MKLAMSAVMLLSLSQASMANEWYASDRSQPNVEQPTYYAEPPPVNIQPPIDPNISVDFLMGKFTPRKHPDFVKIASRYASRKGMYMQREAYEAFKKMHADAKNAGITLTIKSAARNFNYQKGIWERKWTGKRKVEGQRLPQSIPAPVPRALKILEFSSMPSTSRHHWGTDIDLNAFNNKYFASGKGKREYEWLVAYAPFYGFCQPYTPKGRFRPYGYNEEKWHWSYKPLSKHYTQQARVRISDALINGFKGAQAASVIGVVNKYILGIDPQCQ